MRKLAFFAGRKQVRPLVKASAHSDNPDIRSEDPTGFSHKKRFNKIPLAHSFKQSKYE